MRRGLSQETLKEAESKGPDSYVYLRGAEGLQRDIQVSGFDCWVHGRLLTETIDPLWKPCWTKNQEAWVPALALP